ncbi:hypothetical protein [Paraurantiacibacter namhicola]|uniref:Lipoprotein n=1 Tax=Paraurantiacibacter namhicola TaxID=645517 RepID=A0A1C7D7U2_9SPHN|nr:hypothetical protein [Paraurantiacibacter namhicola]ANU07515.1 hypothetical protein A6F65_01208 [Paraurantiacibacter namhicola]
MKCVIVMAGLCAALAACNSSDGAGYTAMQAQEGAAMRFEARDVVGMLNPVCPYTTDPAQQARYEEPKARYEAVKEWVDGKPLATDLAAVEADYAYYWTINQATCGSPDTPETIAELDRNMQVLDQRLTRMEELAGMM